MISQVALAGLEFVSLLPQTQRAGITGMGHHGQLMFKERKKGEREKYKEDGKEWEKKKRKKEVLRRNLLLVSYLTKKIRIVNHKNFGIKYSILPFRSWIFTLLS